MLAKSRLVIKWKMFQMSSYISRCKMPCMNYVWVVTPFFCNMHAVLTNVKCAKPLVWLIAERISFCYYPFEFWCIQEAVIFVEIIVCFKIKHTVKHILRKPYSLALLWMMVECIEPFELGIYLWALWNFIFQFTWKFECYSLEPMTVSCSP